MVKKTNKKPSVPDPGLARVSGLFKSEIGLPPLLDEIPLGIAVLDRSKNVLFMNRNLEALVGFTREQAFGIPCRYIIRSNLCGNGCPLDRLEPGSQAVCQEGDLVNTDRVKAPVRVTFAPVTAGGDRLTGYLATYEDVRFLKDLSSMEGPAFGIGNIIGKSPEMERVFLYLPGIAETDSSVLITGETGTGKDLLAEAIHRASRRSKGPFVKVNCGALPETLLESELFGHKKGAFTGAMEDKPGRFRLARNGTLFLTEIGDLPLSLQVKLLTFLDDKIIYPLGSAKGIPVDVRVIAATHRDLAQMVRDGRFREDLFFRLNVVRIQLPPLRDRGVDIRFLLDHFAACFASKFQKKINGFDDEVMRRLLTYHYPGNVRELRNIVEYAVNICREDSIGLGHLPAYLTDPALVEETRIARNGKQEPRRHVESEDLVRGDMSWPELEKKMILEALAKTGGRKNKAAAMLGWGRSTLWRKMKQHGLDT